MELKKNIKDQNKVLTYLIIMTFFLMIYHINCLQCFSTMWFNFLGCLSESKVEVSQHIIFGELFIKYIK